MEEVGLVARPIRKLWTAEADTKVKMISFWLTEVEDGEIVLDERESAQYGWFSVEEALELKLYPATVVFLEKVRDGEFSLE